MHTTISIQSFTPLQSYNKALKLALTVLKAHAAVLIHYITINLEQAVPFHSTNPDICALPCYPPALPQFLALSRHAYTVCINFYALSSAPGNE